MRPKEISISKSLKSIEKKFRFFYTAFNIKNLFKIFMFKDSEFTRFINVKRFNT